MNEGKPVFAQVAAYIPQRQFRRIVDKYGGNKGVRALSCWDQLLCMMFAQLTSRDSLRDVIVCLNALKHKL